MSSLIQDPSRLAALRQYDVLSGPLPDEIDCISEVALNLFEGSSSVVSFVNPEGEWFRSRCNFDRLYLPLDHSFGAHALRSDKPWVVEDATADAHFHDHPLVRGDPEIRFYVAAPLVTPSDHRIGTLAVFDTTARSLTCTQLTHLQTLANTVIDKLEHTETEERKEAPSFILNPTGANTAVLDEEGTILQVNDNWRSFATDNDAAPLSSVEEGSNYLDAINVSGDVPTQAYARRARDGIQTVLRGRETTFELVYPCHAPGKKRWFQLRAMALDHPRAKAMVVHTDVTSEKRHRQRRRLLETAVEQAKEVILITEGTPFDDPNAEIIYVNPAITAVGGYEPEQIIGNSLHVFFGPKTEPWTLTSLKKHFNRKDSFKGDVTIHRKNGTSYVSNWSVAPVRSNEGTVTHWVAVQRDVTKQRQMEKRLLAAQERERRRIALTMHDEIGGLLTSLQMAIDFALSEEPSTDPGLEEINDVVQDLSTVVRSLTGRLHSRVLEDYGLHEAIARLVREFEEEAGLTINHYVELSSGERLPHLIEKIAFRGIREALSNVSRHAQTNRAQVVVNRESDTLRVHVTDEGVVFQLQNELVENNQYGLLGLRERIERLNGTLEIDTEPEVGTRISMALPLSLGPLQDV